MLRSRRADRPRLAVQRPRVLKYRALSDCRRVSGSPIVPAAGAAARPRPIVLRRGRRVRLARLEVASTPATATSRRPTPSAVIEIGDGVQINNNAFIKSEGPGNQDRRRRADRLGGDDLRQRLPRPAPAAPPRRASRSMAAVELDEDVFVGDRVLILKGVRIGALGDRRRQRRHRVDSRRRHRRRQPGEGDPGGAGWWEAGTPGSDSLTRAPVNLYRSRFTLHLRSYSLIIRSNWAPGIGLTRTALRSVLVRVGQ